MGRSLRLKYHDCLASYHIISRTVGQQFLLGDTEKEKLVQLIQHYSSLFLVEVTGFCVMDNHFHLLVRTLPYSRFSQQDIDARIDSFYKKKTPPTKQARENVRFRLGDISLYVQYIKQEFTRWYNRKHKRTGYLWGDRFKSILLEDGMSVLPCLAYIDLNPLRAGVVKRPEQYRWSSIGMRYAGVGRKFLSFSAALGDEYSDKVQLSYYMKYLYHCGAIQRSGKKHAISKEDREVMEKKEFVFTYKEAFAKKVSYFSRGYALGTKDFLSGFLQQFANHLPHKKEKFYPTVFSPNIFSFQKVSM